MVSQELGDVVVVKAVNVGLCASSEISEEESYQIEEVHQGAAIANLEASL